MRTCAKCSGIILNNMQSMSKQALIDMLRFVESIHHQNHCSDKQLSGFSQFRRWHGIIQFDVYVPANYW